jgi:hypothetical protein
MSSAARAEREALEHAIELHRGELRIALAELRRSALEPLAPRELLRRQPYPWLGLAAGIGFWWAWRSAPRVS